ncbi:Mth938-like domain-containing protein [Roseibium sp. SCP14]|uniref:Mth938-like domain-containing protein n=1 Tax=Roseibium sp. SCP14 TaxID=3141375 RepID=UPI00333726D5
MEIRDAHFPGRAPLDAYGNGGFRFADMSHRGSLLCIPSGIYGWNLKDPTEFSKEAFQRVLDEQDGIEVLLVGTGLDLRPLPGELKELFREANILADPMSTGAAVRTYNVLLSENRAVAAALLAVD